MNLPRKSRCLSPRSHWHFIQDLPLLLARSYILLYSPAALHNVEYQSQDTKQQLKERFREALSSMRSQYAARRPPLASPDTSSTAEQSRLARIEALLEKQNAQCAAAHNRSAAASQRMKEVQAEIILDAAANWSSASSLI